MTEPTLLYNNDADRKLQKLLIWPEAQTSFSDEDFFGATFLKNKDRFSNINDRQARAEFLFYLLVQIGRRRPALFPVPDLCLAAFNILAARHNLAESRLVCLDLGLWPTAVLASGWGAKIAPPLSAQGKSWPEHFCPANLTDDRNTKEALVLGRDPVKLIEDHPSMLDDLSQARGGIVFCYWDFLGVNLHSYARSQWLDYGLIRTLIQFPRPSRQGVIYYPALIETRPGPQEPDSERPKIRLADVRAQTPGPGGLSQAEVLRLTLDPADGEKSIDVTTQELTRHEGLDCTPRRLLASPKGPGELPLTDCTRLIRCQLPRVKPTPNQDESSYFSCREISLSHLDELTGFVKPGAGQPVWFKYFNPNTKDGQYLLKRHDILMCFRGTEATIGRVGFVAEEPNEREHLISGQSLCLIRTKNIDSVWLYYYLRREQIRQRILSRSSGSSMLTVNLGDLRELAIAQPGSTQTAVIGQKHLKLLSLTAEIRKLYAEAEAEIAEMHSESFKHLY